VIVVLWNHEDSEKIQSAYDTLWPYVSYVFGKLSKLHVLPEYGCGKVETCRFFGNAVTTPHPFPTPPLPLPRRPDSS